MNTIERARRIVREVSFHPASSRNFVEHEIQTAVTEERQAIIALCRSLQKGTRHGFAEEILEELIDAINLRGTKF